MSTAAPSPALTVPQARSAWQQAGQTLRELESESAYRLLAGGAFGPATTARWSERRDDVAFVWTAYLALGEHLDRVEAAAGASRWLPGRGSAQVRRLLADPVVAVQGDERGPAARPLTAAATPTVDYTVPDLLEQMGRAFSRVAELVSQVETATAVALPALHASCAAASRAEQDARAAGVRDPSSLRRLYDSAQTLAAQVASDPLAVSVADADAVASDLGREVAALAEATGCARGVEGRVAALDEELLAAGAAVAEATRRRTAVAGRVRGAHGADTDLAGELARLRAERERAVRAVAVDWAATDRRLGDLVTRAVALRGEARVALCVADGLLADRDALRGRLEAFRAKAQARGRVEEPAVTAAYDAAHDELFSAPCDLVRAAALVDGYRRAVDPPGQAR